MTKSSRSLRAIILRLAAILLGLSPFLIAEMTLRAVGMGKPNFHADPYVGFSGQHSLFELNAAADEYKIAQSRRVHFFPDSFATVKPANEFRVFCIGDSTVQGNPWEPETSFTMWLEISLQAADPTRQWNVVNCGGISYASYRIVPIVEEVLRYDPDLLIIHCSHNEFLEDRTYSQLKSVPRPLRRLQAEVVQLRISNILRTALASISSNEDQNDNRAILPGEVHALLDDAGGLEFYHRDDAWHRGVIEHYEYNLRRMALLAKEAHVPLILMNPACQIRDMPPFKAEHRAAVTESQLNQWYGLWDEAREHYANDPRRAIELLRQALAIDDQHAGLHYDLGKVYDVLGQFSDARMAYVRAKEHDICPLRILESMNDVVREVGIDTKTPVVDVRALFDRLSRNGIPGDDWFADHVHPTIPGYQRIADELADEMERLNFVQPQAGWLDLKAQRYDEHLNSLSATYFLVAQKRLHSLMLWAHGRAKKER